MWPALLRYQQPVLQAWVTLLIALIVAGPWIALAMRFGSGNASRWTRVARIGITVGFIDRILVDATFWCPLAALTAGLWAASRERIRRCPDDPAGRARAGLWLAWGLAISVAAALLRENMFVRPAALAFMFMGLYLDRPTSATPDGKKETKAHPRQKSFVVASLTAAGLIFLGLRDPPRPAFLILVGGGIIGWIWFGFEHWRAVRGGNLRPGMKARLVSTGAALAMSVLATLLVLEGYFRYVYDASDANGDLRTSRSWSERHVVLNRWGYRGRECEPVDQWDPYARVVLVGDSFVFGWGIADDDDLLAPQLERALAGGSTPPVRVFPVAHGGINTVTQTEYFRRHGVLLEPHLVVLAYHVNDVLDRTVNLRWPGPLYEMWRPLMRASDFVEFFAWHTYVRLIPGAGLDESARFGRFSDDKAFARHADDVRTLIREFRSCGADAIVLMYPYMDWPTDAGAQRDALDRMAALFSGLDVPVVDVSRLADLSERRYHANPFDPHPSAELHQVVVPVLAEQVTSALSSGGAPAQ